MEFTLTPTNLSVGQQLHGYTVKRIAELPDIQAQFIELEHTSGAKHIHIARNDDNHSFTSVFPTVPQDSTGVAHILEHMVLAGSQKYPCKDPFFSMIPRSLNTFMNAFTSSDWTAYPFSSRNEVDYFNLLSVYLDAVFFPLLTHTTFMREGHRLEYTDPSDASSGLAFQGIVFNEMKGGMASDSAVMSKLLGKALYPDLTYAHNSGGEPENILDLTWENLQTFHAKHYHPSNAFMFSYGNLPLERHLEAINRLALSKFAKLEVDTSIPDQPRFAAPHSLEGSYPSSETERKSQVALVWMTVPSFDSYQVLQMQVLSDVLLGNPAAPLRKALIDSSLGENLASGSGYSNDFRQGRFGAGLKGTDPQHAETIQKIILDTLEAVAQSGLDAHAVESSLHQLEIQTKEVSNSGFPYSLRLFFAVAGTWIYGGDPLAELNFNESLERLQLERQAPHFWQDLIRRELLDNPHRALVILKPDPEKAKAQLEAEAQRLEGIEQGLSEEAKQKVVADALQLLQMQDDVDNVDILPTLEVSDIRTTVPDVQYQQLERPGLTVGLCPQPTNGLVYIDVQLDFSVLSEAQKDLLAVYTFALTKSGAAGQSYLEIAAQLEAYTGGIAAGIAVASSPDRLEENVQHFSLSGKALLRNAPQLIGLMHDFLSQPNFEADRLIQLLRQQRSGLQAGVVQNGHGYARSLASAQLSPTAALRERLSGLSLLARLKVLTESDPAALEGLCSQLAELTAVLHTGNAALCVTAEQSTLDSFAENQTLEPLYTLLEGEKAAPTVSTGLQPRQPQARTTDVPVAYNAKVIQTVAYNHPDAPALLALASLLTSSYTLRELREKGGAYGGFASYDPQNGLFSFSSYRDPHIRRTFEVFENALEYVLSDEIGLREATEALIQSGGSLDPLTSPDTLGRSRFFGDLGGYSKTRQEQFRSQLVAVTLEDLRRVASSYLGSPNFAIALISNPDKVAEVKEELKLEVAGI
jgi:presequence protease